MDLVDGERLLPGIAGASLLHPRGVAPGVNAFEPVHDARGGRRYLGVERVWIGLEKDVAVRRAQLELVEIALGGAGHEHLPDAGCPVALHLVHQAVPAVERTDDGDALGVRRPYREGDAGDRADLPRMGAQPFVDAVVIALAEQPLIFAAEGEVAKRVAVDRLPRQAVAVEHAQPVVGGHLGQARFEQPGVVDHPHLVDDLGLVRRQHLHARWRPASSPGRRPPLRLRIAPPPAWSGADPARRTGRRACRRRCVRSPDRTASAPPRVRGRAAASRETGPGNSRADPPEKPRRRDPFGSHRRDIARARMPRWKEGRCGPLLSRDRRPKRRAPRRRARRAACRRTRRDRSSAGGRLQPVSRSSTPNPCRWHASIHATRSSGAAKGGPNANRLALARPSSGAGSST